MSTEQSIPVDDHQDIVAAKGGIKIVKSAPFVVMKALLASQIGTCVGLGGVLTGLFVMPRLYGLTDKFERLDNDSALNRLKVLYFPFVYVPIAQWINIGASIISTSRHVNTSKFMLITNLVTFMVISYCAFKTSAKGSIRRLLWGIIEEEVERAIDDKIEELERETKQLKEAEINNC